MKGLNKAYEIGYDEGWEEGKEIGRIEGREEGIKEGRIESSKKIIMNLISEKLDVKEIARIMNMSLEEISSILGEPINA